MGSIFADCGRDRAAPDAVMMSRSALIRGDMGRREDPGHGPAKGSAAE